MCRAVDSTFRCLQTNHKPARGRQPAWPALGYIGPKTSSATSRTRVLWFLVAIACLILPENIRADPIPSLATRSGFALGSDSTVNNGPTSINQINDYTGSATLRGNITANITLSTAGSLTEVHVNSVTLDGNPVTLGGSSYDYFVVEVIGHMKLTESASLLPNGGLSPSSVIYSSSGKPWTIDIQIGNTLDGILTAPNGAIGLNGRFNGQLILRRDTTPQPSPPATGPSAPVPEPSTFSLLCCGLLLLAVGALIRRRTLR